MRYHTHLHDSIPYDRVHNSRQGTLVTNDLDIARLDHAGTDNPKTCNHVKRHVTPLTIINGKPLIATNRDYILRVGVSY